MIFCQMCSISNLRTEAMRFVLVPTTNVSVEHFWPNVLFLHVDGEVRSGDATGGALRGCAHSQTLLRQCLPGHACI